VRVSRMTRQS